MHPDSLLELVSLITQKYPEYLQLISSRTDKEFDDALERFLERIIYNIEKYANYLYPLAEDAITACITVALDAIPGLHAEKQVHSKDNIDITITAENTSPLRIRLGEAKIYDGKTYHVKGLKQLVERYSTGREGFGIMVEYVKKPNIMGLIRSLRIHMDTNLPCAQIEKSEDHWIKWAFVTHHKHSSGETIRVIHLSCNLYCG